MVLPAGTKHIQDLTKSFLRELESKNSGAQFAGQLYDILLGQPLGAFHKSRLLISPDGVLHLLPFEALRDGTGNLVIGSKVVSYTPSASVLQALRTQRPRTPASLPLLAVGDVDYRFIRLPSRATQNSLAAAILRGIATLTGSQLENLPASRDEVLSIGAILGGDTQLLLGQDATETRFKALPLSDFRVIHLSVHAISDPQYPDRAALILGSDPKTPDDGLLQVREIVRLPLNADLVTLSACDTGIGTVEGQAGVVSLEQAFLMSGARTVAASLWKVEDRSTTTLMKGFYLHLAQHDDKASALAHAKRDLLERYGELSPYYWAGFVLVGEGSDAIQLDH
jgi:CHAT domain-containing protein